VVAIIQQRTGTNGKARNHVSSLHSLLMQLCALETHIRISTNLKKFVDFMTNHTSGPEPSPCPLEDRASGPKISKSHCGLQWLCVTPARHVYWLARFLAATLSQKYDRGLSNSQSGSIFMLCRRIFLHSLCNRHFLVQSNRYTRIHSHSKRTSPIAYTVM